MLKYEKKAFVKFFTIYFGSVALLILASGYFYFQEQTKSLVEKEHFSMIEYVRQLKMNKEPKSDGSITHTITDKKIQNFSMDNFEIGEHYFKKYMPYSWYEGYIVVKKDKKSFYKKLFLLRAKIIFVQILLLVLFAIISYFLAKEALKPMQDAIKKLDNFSKDLIHDLNTPITSILLNMKILQRDKNLSSNKALERVKKNVQNISELHKNLTTLLEEDTMQIQRTNLIPILKDVIATHQKIYTDIIYSVELKEFYASVNKNAFIQIITNLVSNASKYNKKGGFVKIYANGEILHIEDSGIGIKNPDKIFNRSYKEQKSGTGLGLDITKRLCDAMGIEIFVTSKTQEGSIVSLKFYHV